MSSYLPDGTPTLVSLESESPLAKRTLKKMRSYLPDGTPTWVRLESESPLANRTLRKNKFRNAYG